MRGEPKTKNKSRKDQTMNLFSSESVTPGHPDKTCDIISDAILDSILDLDPQAHVAVECFITSKGLHIGGEVRTSGEFLNKSFIKSIARNELLHIGWNQDNGLNPATFPITNEIILQSHEIGEAVDTAHDVASRTASLENIGAGDQGMMFGYAEQSNNNYMPLTIMAAHECAMKLTSLRHEYGWLRPDGKTQVTTCKRGSKTLIHSLLVSAQHTPTISIETVRAELSKKFRFMLEENYDLDDDFHITINPAGAWTIGGALADTGLTGRKIIVDTYGGSAPHGGGAFSGKDPSKVDRTGAYAARQIAKSIVVNGYANKCLIQISYAIGLSQPVGVDVNTYGTGDDEKLSRLVQQKVDLRPGAIIERLNLQRPIYARTACFGHFSNPEYPWEKVIDLS